MEAFSHFFIHSLPHEVRHVTYSRCYFRGCGPGVEAQEQKKAASPKAEIVFDVSIEALRQMPGFENVALEELIQFDSKGSPFGAGFGISDISRISGAISLPKQVGDLARVFYENEFPFDFMVQIHFSNKANVRQLSDYLVAQKYSREKMGDIELVRLPVPDTKTSVLLRHGQSSIAIGTKAFLSRTINEVISPNSRRSWVNCGKAPIRFVIDLERTKSFVDEIFQLANFEDAQVQLEKVRQQANAVSVSLFPDSGGLFQVGVSSNSIEEIGVLQKRLDFLSFELRTALNRVLIPLSQEGNLEPVAIDGISTSVNQAEVTMVVAKPKNFPSMIQKATLVAKEKTETAQADKEQAAKQLSKR